MGKALDELLAHWDRHVPGTPFHPDDVPFLEKAGLTDAFSRHLAPYPWVGDLRSARVWVLMRNPSIGDADHLEEERAPLAQLIEANLRRLPADYPFLHLDPSLDPSDAYNWWNRRRGMGRLVTQLAREMRMESDQIRKLVSRRVAILELCPYRSKAFPTAVLQSKSSRLARAAALEAVQESLAGARRGFVMPWDPTCWGLPVEAFESVIRNQRSQGFTFRMGARSQFGEHIRKYAFGVG